MSTLRLSSLLWLALASSPAAAHDFWIAPEAFRRPAPSAEMPLVRLPVQLCIGHPGEFEPYARSERHLLRFGALRAAGAERPVGGEFGAQPAGVAELDAPGLWTLVYVSNPSSITLEAERFENYLREEGLAAVSAERTARGETQSPGRERYSRSAKALVQVGTEGSAALPPLAGLPLELQPLSPPAGLRSLADGKLELPLEVRFEGRPLAGMQVNLDRFDGQGETLVARSDEQGRVRFELPSSGVWLATGVHMQRLTDDPDHEWRSYWASLTAEFEARQP
jgi:uncharacterized GH25 family protein